MRKGFDNWLFRSTQSIGGVILLQNKRKHKRASLNLKETKQRRAKHLLIATKEEPFYDPGVEPNILNLSGCIEGPEPLLGGDEPAGPGAGPLKLGGPPAGGKGGIAPIVGGNGGGARAKKQISKTLIGIQLDCNGRHTSKTWRRHSHTRRRHATVRRKWRSSTRRHRRRKSWGTWWKRWPSYKSLMRIVKIG